MVESILMAHGVEVNDAMALRLIKDGGTAQAV